MTKETNKKDKTIRVYAEPKRVFINDFNKQRVTNFEIHVFDKIGKSIDSCMTDREDLVAGILFYMQYTYNVHQENTFWEGESSQNALTLNGIKRRYYNK
jgi:hypothetical protein